MTTLLSDNLTQIILSVIAIFGALANLIVTWILANKQRDNARRVHSLENTEDPTSEDVAHMYGVAEKTLEAVNKLLRKHGRGVQARAEAVARAAEQIDVQQQPTPEPKRRRGGLRRIRGKTSQTQEQTSLDDFAS